MKMSGLRWVMIGLVFLATVINYIDRQTVSVLKTSISKDLGLSNADYAAIQNSFLRVLRHQPVAVGPALRRDRHASRVHLLDRAVVARGARACDRAQRRRIRRLPRRARLRRSRQLARRGEDGRRMVPGSRTRAGDGHLQHRRGGRRRDLAADHRLAGHRRTAGGRRSSSPARSASSGWRCGSRCFAPRPSIRGSPRRSARTFSTARHRGRHPDRHGVRAGCSCSPTDRPGPS